jgi:hypothetical protein
VALDVAAAHMAPVVHRTLLALRDWLTPPLPATLAADGTTEEPSAKRRRTASTTPLATSSADTGRDGSLSGGEGDTQPGHAAAEASGSDVAFSGIAHLVVVAVVDRVLLLPRGAPGTPSTAGTPRRLARRAGAAKDTEAKMQDDNSPYTLSGSATPAADGDGAAGDVRRVLVRLRPDIARIVQAVTHAAVCKRRTRSSLHACTAPSQA